MTTVESDIGRSAEGAESGGRPAPEMLEVKRVLLLLAGVALLAGAAELVVALILKTGFGQVLRISRDIVWMAPLGQLLLLLPAVALLHAAGVLLPALRRLRSTLFVLLFIALCSILLFVGFLHDLAVVALAAGIAWRLAVSGSRNEAALYGAFRRLVPAFALLFVLLGVGFRGAEMIRERRALAALPEAGPGAPNVILIIWDTVRAASLSLYGHDLPTTPNLEVLAARGAVFERAVSTSSWTLPSHVSMFTGILPHETTANWATPFDGRRQTLAEVLAERGYATGGFAANGLYVQWENGLDKGFARFEDYRVTPGQVFLSTALGRRIASGRHGWGIGLPFRLAGYSEILGRKRADDVNSAFLDWVDERGDRPYFAFLNYYDAHLPYLPPEPFAGQFGRPRQPFNFLERVRREIAGLQQWDIPPEAIDAELAAYEEAITYMDDRLGLLIEELEARGDLDNTLIILASDHGEEFGEHEDFEHGTNLYMEQIHVPLVIVYPGRVPAGVRIADPVSIRDIPATVTDLLDLDESVSFPGVALTGTWGTASDTSRTVIAELTPGLQPDRLMCAAIAPRYHLVRNPDGTTELYDWIADPAERLNIVTSPRSAGTVERLDAILMADAGCHQ